MLPPLGRSAIYSEDDPEYRRYLAAQERENEAVEEEGGEDEDEEEDEIGVVRAVFAPLALRLSSTRIVSHALAPLSRSAGESTPSRRRSSRAARLPR